VKLKLYYVHRLPIKASFCLLLNVKRREIPDYTLICPNPEQSRGGGEP
jgi:hypothetical protein